MTERKRETEKGEKVHTHGKKREREGRDWCTKGEVGGGGGNGRGRSRGVAPPRMALRS